MASPFLEQLARNGPESCEKRSPDEARRWCRQLVESHYENFSVLSRLVPANVRDDFAAIYAYCRWSDDLGDEVGDPARSLELFRWWREELALCYEGEPRHPVFVALRPTIEQHELPMQPFVDLVSAFEQDQTKIRYETWAELIDYCRRSADPVGRLVLMVCGEPRTDDRFERSDAICTALQLTNHWQDVKRDVLDRDRIYIPSELHSIEEFESRLRRSAEQGWAVDHAFLSEFRAVMRSCVERTWPLFEKGEGLLQLLSPRTDPVIWLFIAGGEHVLRQIEMWNYETCLHRPKLSRTRKSMLVLRAMLRRRRLVRRGTVGGRAA